MGNYQFHYLNVTYFVYQYNLLLNFKLKINICKEAYGVKSIITRKLKLIIVSDKRSKFRAYC